MSVPGTRVLTHPLLLPTLYHWNFQFGSLAVLNFFFPLLPTCPLGALFPVKSSINMMHALIMADGADGHLGPPESRFLSGHEVVLVLLPGGRGEVGESHKQVSDTD